MKILGIDFGTTFTKASVFESGVNNGRPMQVAMNPNAIDFGFGATRYAMPTVVAVANGNYYVGNQALNTKLVSDCFFDNFKTVLERNDEYASKELNITYHELICRILRHVRECIVDGDTADEILLIDKIVLTVPVSTVPYGNRWNRMLNAAREVFPEVESIEILAEPIAAGYALLGDRIHSDKRINGKCFIVYDFGGGTFDATILKVEDGQIFVVGKSVGSDDEQRWGGIYIDDLIKREYIKNGAAIRRAIDSRDSLSMKERFSLETSLRIEPTKAKIELSKHDSYDFIRGDYTISRKLFEDLCSDMISDTIKCTMNLLSSKEDEGFALSLKDIDTVFLVGGSSRMPVITRYWEEQREIGDKDGKHEKYDFKLTKCDLEIVASGAAFYPALRVSPDSLIRHGGRHLKNNRYSKAALCFQNAENDLGKYLLGTLYYTGLIGLKRNYREAIRLFNEADNHHAHTMLAIMAFQGGQGMPRNHAVAKDHLALAGSSEVTRALSNVLNSNSGSSHDFDKIYGYDPVAAYINTIEDDASCDEDTGTESECEVKPVKPGLGVFEILSNGNYKPWT